MGVKPDFTVLKGGTQEGPDRIDYIHRRTDNADVYFICNSAKETKSLLCRFRDAEGRAEVWYPVTGEICSPQAVIRQPATPAISSWSFLPSDRPSWYFAAMVEAPEKTALTLYRRHLQERIPIEGKWTVKFQPGRLAPEYVEWDGLIDWTNSEEPGIKYFSGNGHLFDSV